MALADGLFGVATNTDTDTEIFTGHPCAGTAMRGRGKHLVRQRSQEFGRRPRVRSALVRPRTGSTVRRVPACPAAVRTDDRDATTIGSQVQSAQVVHDQGLGPVARRRGLLLLVAAALNVLLWLFLSLFHR